MSKDLNCWGWPFRWHQGNNLEKKLHNIVSYFEIILRIEPFIYVCISTVRPVFKATRVSGLFYCRPHFPHCWKGDREQTSISYRSPGFILANRQVWEGVYELWGHPTCGSKLCSLSIEMKRNNRKIRRALPWMVCREIKIKAEEIQCCTRVGLVR